MLFGAVPYEASSALVRIWLIPITCRRKAQDLFFNKGLIVFL